MSFPADIKGCMRECILALLWPRSDIYDFFSSHGCTKPELKQIENAAKRELSRAKMVDLMFRAISSRDDGGIGVFRSILHSLVNWSDFNSYYFDKLRKLDRNDAERKLDHLRQLQEIRDAKIKATRAKRESKEAEVQTAKKSIVQVRDEFLNLHAGTTSPQERGYVLETILSELARIVRLEVTEPFKVVGEQIDGAIKYDGEHYLVEAKWQNVLASNEPVYQFVAKVEGKMYGRGIFVSINGFSEDVVQSVTVGKALRTIFVDGEDLILVLEEQIAFDRMIDRKVKAAQTRGLIYVNPISGKAKTSGQS